MDRIRAIVDIKTITETVRTYLREIRDCELWTEFKPHADSTLGIGSGGFLLGLRLPGYSVIPLGHPSKNAQ